MGEYLGKYTFTSYSGSPNWAVEIDFRTKDNKTSGIARLNRKGAETYLTMRQENESKFLETPVWNNSIDIESSDESVEILSNPEEMGQDEDMKNSNRMNFRVDEDMFSDGTSSEGVMQVTKWFKMKME